MEGGREEWDTLPTLGRFSVREQAVVWRDTRLVFVGGGRRGEAAQQVPGGQWLESRALAQGWPLSPARMSGVMGGAGADLGTEGQVRRLLVAGGSLTAGFLRDV